MVVWAPGSQHHSEGGLGWLWGRELPTQVRGAPVPAPASDPESVQGSLGPGLAAEPEGQGAASPALPQSWVAPAPAPRLGLGLRGTRAPLASTPLLLSGPAVPSCFPALWVTCFPAVKSLLGGGTRGRSPAAARAHPLRQAGPAGAPRVTSPRGTHSPGPSEEPSVPETDGETEAPVHSMP